MPKTNNKSRLSSYDVQRVIMTVLLVLLVVTALVLVFQARSDSTGELGSPQTTNQDDSTTMTEEVQ